MAYELLAIGVRLACAWLTIGLRSAYDWLAFGSQSLHTDDDLSSLKTVTPQEQKLGAHFTLIVKSWHDVLPMAQQLVQPAVRPRHLRTLLSWLQVRPRGEQT